MLGDYGEIIKLAESITGATVNTRRRNNGLVLEHVFKNACVVRWKLLKKRTDITIEFIRDLEIIK